MAIVKPGEQPVFPNPDGDPRITAFNSASRYMNRSSKVEAMRRVADSIPMLKPNSIKHRAAIVELTRLAAELNQRSFLDGRL